jgi:phytoene dehydrogenase-like protein
MAGKSVAIIGAGLAGLSAGCYAQMNGYESRIFEHASKPGGVAAWWKRGEYLIDSGIHFLIAHRSGSPAYDLYRELGTVQVNTCLDMSTYLRFVDEATDQRVDITTNLGRLAEDLKRISPNDADKIQKLIREAYKLKDSPELVDMGMSMPPELMRPVDTVKELWNMRSFLKYFIGDFSKPVKEYVRSVHSPLLSKIFENLFSPEGPVWFAVMILAMLAGGQLGLLEGGCPGFVLAIEKRYKALRGNVFYNSTVEKILVENDKAIGISLGDGSVHKADIVVSAADGYGTIFEMLDGRYVNDKIRKRYASWKLFRPTVTVTFGVAREFRDDPPLNMFLLRSPIRVGTHDNDGLSLRIFNYSNAFAPRGKTVIQVILETEWDYWEGLRKDRPRYESEKDRVANEVLERLEAHYPGLSSQVEMIDVATPQTTWRYTLNHRGSPMGWMISQKSLMTQIPRSLPGLRDFYMAGQWVVPGGGVPACIYSGRHVVQILCRRDGKPFRTSIP